jgi:hypothetical protein
MPNVKCQMPNTTEFGIRHSEFSIDTQVVSLSGLLMLVADGRLR